MAFETFTQDLTVCEWFDIVHLYLFYNEIEHPRVLFLRVMLYRIRDENEHISMDPENYIGQEDKKTSL